MTSTVGYPSRLVLVLGRSKVIGVVLVKLQRYEEMMLSDDETVPVSRRSTRIQKLHRRGLLVLYGTTSNVESFLARLEEAGYMTYESDI